MSPPLGWAPRDPRSSGGVDNFNPFWTNYTHAMTSVIIYGTGQTAYDVVSAIRVGPIQRDLVLVRGRFTEIRIPPDQWTRFEADRVHRPLESRRSSGIDWSRRSIREERSLP